MTEKLFENDSFLDHETGRVISCQECESGFEIILDRTVFFPEGGGQPGDRGWLSGINVLDTYYRDGELIHLCDAPIAPGSLAEEKLDMERRLDHIQQHTGEHMLSFAFWKLFGAMNVGFHMNEKIATIDLDQELTAQQMREAEAFANHQIYENLPIRAYETTLSRLKNQKVRKISAKAGENPRVVEIEKGDICTCCGTHANFTGTVGIIKIIKSEKMRAGVRIEFLCGGRALQFFERQNGTARILMTEMSTDFDAIPLRLRELKSDMARIKARLKEKSEALLQLRAKELRDQSENGVILALEENVTSSEARSLLNRLVEDSKAAAVVVFADAERVNYVCAAGKDSPADCKYFCDLLGSLYNGKGGGSKSFAQGGGKFSSDWRQRAETFREYIKRR